MTDFILAVPSDLVREGMRTALQTQKNYHIAASISTLRELREATQQYPFAVVVLGSHLAGDGTIETWRRLLRRHSDLQLVLWAHRFQDVLDFQCNLPQVDAYLLENASSAEFLAACKAAATGQMFVASTVAEYLAKNPRRNEQVRLLKCLSRREIQVTQMLGQGIRVAEIAKHLNISSKTVNTFRYRIFDKLNLSGDVELAHLAIQTGLVNLDNVQEVNHVTHEQLEENL